MRVYVDMDEVLVDFVGGCCAVHGITVEELNQRRQVGEWSIVEPLGTTLDGMWEPIHGKVDFWEQLQPLPWFTQLLNAVWSVSTDWYVVTAPSRCDTSYTGKVKWLKKQFGNDFDRFLITPHKHLFANSFSVLIDDRLRNVENFRMAGGHGVIFPSLGGPLHAQVDNPVKYVHSELVKYNIQCQQATAALSWFNAKSQQILKQFRS